MPPQNFGQLGLRMRLEGFVLVSLFCSFFVHGIFSWVACRPPTPAVGPPAVVASRGSRAWVGLRILGMGKCAQLCWRTVRHEMRPVFVEEEIPFRLGLSHTSALSLPSQKSPASFCVPLTVSSVGTLQVPCLLDLSRTSAPSWAMQRRPLASCCPLTMGSVGAVRVACQVSEELSRARGSEVRVVILIAEEFFHLPAPCVSMMSPSFVRAWVAPRRISVTLSSASSVVVVRPRVYWFCLPRPCSLWHRRVGFLDFCWR